MNNYRIFAHNGYLMIGITQDVQFDVQAANAEDAIEEFIREQRFERVGPLSVRIKQVTNLDLNTIVDGAQYADLVAPDGTLLNEAAAILKGTKQ